YAGEADVYERLGYQFIPPELRENAGELEAARKGELPTLVELADIKGDLHSHTTYSDGRDSLEQMALAARERGYAYLAITDHPRGTLAEQNLEIDALNERLKPFKLLRGIEVNIRIDGSLSLPDEVLAERDWVSFRDDGAAAVEWAARYLEQVGEYPVLAQVRPGDITSRLPASPPERGEPFADVLRDVDEILLPGITHWQSPRFFAYFAVSASEPGILAELLAATLNSVAFLWRTSPASTEREALTLAWAAPLLGLA